MKLDKNTLKSMALSVVVGIVPMIGNAATCKEAQEALEKAVVADKALLDLQEKQIREASFIRQDVEELWFSVVAELAEERLSKLSSELAKLAPDSALSAEQTSLMAKAEAISARENLTEEEFEEALQKLHSDLKKEGVKQIAEARSELEKDEEAMRGLIAQKCEGAPSKSDSPKVDDPLEFVVAYSQQRWKAAQREKGDGAKVVKAITDISITDIEEYGLLGGPNSDARNGIKAVTGIDTLDVQKYGVFGGPNSDARKVEQAIQKATGVSLADIQKHGIFGGPNSDANKVNDALREATGVSVKDIIDNGPLGGENSDARKVYNGVKKGLNKLNPF